MDINLLTISFVGVFKTPLPMIQQLDPEFCRNIFHSPENTVSGFTPAAGFVIRLNTAPAPLINISLDKFIIVARNIDELFEYIEAIRPVVPEYEYQAYGLNRDIECLNVPTHNISIWMHEHFIQNKYKIGSRFNACSRFNLQFDVEEHEILNLDFEPRAGVANGLFVAVNHHNVYPIIGFPPLEELQKLYNSSEEKVNNYLKIVCQDE